MQQPPEVQWAAFRSQRLQARSILQFGAPPSLATILGNQQMVQHDPLLEGGLLQSPHPNFRL
jgi:hypothetical protein